MIRDRYCDTPDGQLDAKKMRVRVRQEDDRVMITTKHKQKVEKAKKIIGKKADRVLKAKIAKEEDVYVPSLDAAFAAIKVMGLEVVRTKQKMRISWRLDKAAVCDVDFYDGLPPVVEIEAQEVEDIYTWIDRLGLSEYRVTTWGSRKLFKHYNGVSY
jgi:adenylate cyclase class IV